MFFLKIALAVLFIGTLSYSFKIAEGLKYEAEGDAESFIGLGVGLAKTQKYGHLDIRGGLLRAFRENRISKEDYNLIGHSTWRPPIWPFLIGAIFLIFGYNLTYLIIFKFLLHLLGTFVFFKTLKLLKLPEISVIIGAFLYGINPAWQLYSRVFLSEPITLFLITLWAYFLVRFWCKKSGFLPQAILGGVLILSHPYYVFLPFSVWFMLFLRKLVSLKIFVFSSLVCACVVSMWIIRNAVVLNTTEVVITTSSGAVMAKGWNKNITDVHTNTKGDLADEAVVLEGYDYDETTIINEVDRMQLYKNASLHFIRSNPDLILPIIGTKLKSAFNPFPETPRPGMLETGRWLIQFLSLISLLYLLFFQRNKLFQSLALGLIISTIGITILTYSGFRFRMPQVGLEILFIVFVLDDALKKYRNKRSIAGKN